MYKYYLFLIFTVCFCKAQVVIGSSNITPAAMLKLDSNIKGLRIPVFSITNNSDAVTPIPAPANGLMIYNTNISLPNGIARSIGYWGGDSKYHFQGTRDIARRTVASGRIPVLIFSAKIGPKPIITTGSAQVSLTETEILEDTYFGWSSSSNQYNISMTGVYTIEFIGQISHASGASYGFVDILRNGASLNAGCAAPFISSLNKSFPSSHVTVNNITANNNLRFEYKLDVTNFKLESGTINIYQH